MCLVAAPIVLLVGAVLHPQSKEDPASHLRVVADNPDRYYAAHALLLVGLALFLPAVLGLMHRYERARRRSDISEAASR